MLYHRGLNSFVDAVVGWKYLGFILNRSTGPHRELFRFFVEQERSYEAFQSGVPRSLARWTAVHNPADDHDNDHRRQRHEPERLPDPVADRELSACEEITVTAEVAETAEKFRR